MSRVFLFSQVTVFCLLLLWVWAGAGGEFMRKPVGKWSHDADGLLACYLAALGSWRS